MHSGASVTAWSRARPRQLPPSRVFCRCWSRALVSSRPSCRFMSPCATCPMPRRMSAGCVKGPAHGRDRASVLRRCVPCGRRSGFAACVRARPGNEARGPGAGSQRHPWIPRSTRDAAIGLRGRPQPLALRETTSGSGRRRGSPDPGPGGGCRARGRCDRRDRAWSCRPVRTTSLRRPTIPCGSGPRTSHARRGAAGHRRSATSSTLHAGLRRTPEIVHLRGRRLPLVAAPHFQP